MPDIDWTVLPPGVTRGWFAAPSGTLATIECGPEDGDPVVLAPGVTGSKEDFLLMMPLLAEAGYRVIAFDLAGQYQSAGAGPENLRPPRRRYDNQLFIDDLVAILESRIAPAHVLGYSFAGTVAGLTIAQRPELFASLALLTAPPQPGQSFRGIKRVGRLTSVARPGVGAAVMIAGVRANATGVPPMRLRFVRMRFDYTRRASVRDVIGLMMHVPDVRAEVARVPVPKLIAVGQHDLWPVELHRELAEAIGAELAIYSTGHSPCETAPHQLVRDLLALYSRAAARDR
nr:alpha/beta hydrolase [Galbitalea soli]